MKKIYLFLTLLCLTPAINPASAQRLEAFSEKPNEFIGQLEDFMTASKQQASEETLREFRDAFQGGLLTDEEFRILHRTANAMLAQRMSSNPYFRQYLDGVLLVKRAEDGQNRFAAWHRILEGMLKDEESTRSQYQQFLEFSANFFQHSALKYSDYGLSWYAQTDDYGLRYREGVPSVIFDQLDLIAIRKEDSIMIRKTAGEFFPLKQLWRGLGGQTTWERVDLPEVYVELTEYEVEVKKSLYEADSVKLHYPLYFGGRSVVGSFSDKLTASYRATEGSYPRFESKEQLLDINNIGEGIAFQGGFRLQGRTVYGFGTKDQPARVQIYKNGDQPAFRGAAELFTIRHEERIVGERAEAILYFENDSIFHPSVDIRFEIPNREMQLSRGDRGSDRNPFFNSLHEVNIDVDKINAYFNSDSIVIGQAKIGPRFKSDVSFESLEYFRKADYQRFQGIATSNPIAIMAVLAEKEDTSFIDANRLARYMNSSYTVKSIQGLLYDLAAEGFINYDSDKEVVEIKDKVFHYSKADQNKVDYDVLKINSKTEQANAVLDPETLNLQISGVPAIEFSASQRVGIKPVNDEVVLRPNRNIDFDGRIFAGFSTLEGKNYHFDYDRFKIDLDSVRFFDLYIPTGKRDENQRPEAFSIGSRIEHLTGVLLIDAPSNKSGQEEIEMFPSLQSKENSFVYYDREATQDGAYHRDSFYFKLDPFSFNQLDNFTAEDVAFEGSLISADIFPDFRETLVIQEEDQSLGFISDTPPEGYPAYTGKGQYTGAITLSNKGLLGLGNLRYLGASVDAEDIIFKPRQMLATADRFDLEEDRPEEVPQAHGVDVAINWRPYRDSMYISSEEAPFDLFKENNHNLDGTLILTPGGLKGRGLFEWDKARMRSQLFSFGAFSAQADTTTLEIKTNELDRLALETNNVNGVVDFDEQEARFEANRELHEILLHYHQFKTSMTQFVWDMKDEKVAFETDLDKPGRFQSIHPDQDSLRFEGEKALLDLKTNLLSIEGIPHIVAADAFIYPDSNWIEIQKDGVITELTNARIVADTLNQNHVINRATVDILGRRLYEATGFYEYNIGDREQEIEFSNIIGQPVGKGSYDEKRVVTRATGEVTPADSFFIDVKTGFQGRISLSAESKNLKFDGFARITADKLPYKYWFTVSCEADKNDLAVAFESPKSIEGEPLETGLFLSKETARLYPRAMMPLYFRKDRPILRTTGIFKYDRERDQFVFGDSLKIVDDVPKGNILRFDNRDASVLAEGKFTLGSGLKYISVDAAGRATTEFPPPPPEEEEKEEAESDIMMPEGGDMMLPPDETETTGEVAAEGEAAPLPPDQPELPPVEAELMTGVKLILPEVLLKEMITDFQSATFGSASIGYLADLNFYKKTVAELFPDDKNMQEVVAGMSLGLLDIPKKYNPYTFLFSRLKMKWNTEYQSLVTTEKQAGVISINGETINKTVDCHVEIKMPSNEDDRLYIYLKSPSTYYYFFGFKQGILSIVSNNTKFMDELLSLKNKDLIVKMDDGETYEIQAVEPGTATLFLRRVEAANRG